MAGALRHVKLRTTTARQSKPIWPIFVIAVLLAALTWIVFGQTLHHEFVNYDDQRYVYENPRITAGLSATAVVWAFTHVHSENWHPLTTISHMFDCQLYGLRPGGHHATNRSEERRVGKECRSRWS